MIPNIIHFIFGLVDDFGKKPFSIIHYLAIKSADEINKPDNIYLYYNFLPTGYWWDRVINEDLIELVSIDNFSDIFGNKLRHYAHKADVLRLMILIEYGGIYLDIDTICLKPLNPFLSNNCSMGEEECNGVKYGLCNAVIIAEKNSLFLKYWLATYKYFRSKGHDKYWGEHSIIVPFRISKLFPNLINVLPSSYFFYPSYSERDLRLLFKYNISIDNSFVIHLWENVSYDAYLQYLNEENIKELDTTYNIAARSFL